MITMLVLFLLLGIAVGSFLNVVADRLPAGKSIISPPSHCPTCQRRIARRDLIPIISYLWLKGRCRYCGVKIPVRSFVVEIITGLLFAFLYWHFNLSYDLLVVIIYTCFFIVLFITDLERHLLPNQIVYSGIVVAVILAAVGTLLGFEPSYVSGTFSGFSKLWIVNAALGGVIGFVFLFVLAVISELIFHRMGMGGGDIKLAGLIGLATGFPLILVTIYFAAVGGGLVAAILLLLKIKHWKQYIAYGTILVVAALLAFVWGNVFLSWYISAGRLPISR